MALITKNTAVQGYDSLGKFKRLLGKLITDSFTNYNETLEETFELTKGRCFYCGQKLYIKLINGNEKLIPTATIDHVIPSSEMGLLVPGNTVLACECCNKEKGSMSAKDFFLSRYSNQKVTLYDTPDEFDNIIEELTIRYSTDWPMMFLLNQRINSGELNELSIETILKCASVNPSENKEVMLDFSPTIAKESTKSTDEIEDIPDEIRDLVEKALKLSGKTNAKALNVERKCLLNLVLDLSCINKNIVNDLKTITRKEIINEVKRTGKNFNTDIERVITLVGVLYNNKQLIFNTNVAQSARNKKNAK